MKIEAIVFHATPSGATIEKCIGSRLPVQPHMWAVRKDGFCLAKYGYEGYEWEHEPLPSSRTDEFYARFRYATFKEAMARLEEVAQ